MRRGSFAWHHLYSFGIHQSVCVAVLLLGILHTASVLSGTLFSGNQFYYYVFYLPSSPQTRHLRHETQVIVAEKRDRVDFPRVVSLEHFLEKHFMMQTTSAANKHKSLWLEPLERPQEGNSVDLYLESADLGDLGDDPTRFYSIKDSSDLPGMERRKFPSHDIDPHCKPVSPWQSRSFPVCNELHADDMKGGLLNNEISLLSSQGSWRIAWRKEAHPFNSTLVWKTFR